MSVRTKFKLCMVGWTQYKSDQASAKPDLTFTNVTNVDLADKHQMSDCYN